MARSGILLFTNVSAANAVTLFDAATDGGPCTELVVRYYNDLQGSPNALFNLLINAWNSASSTRSKSSVSIVDEAVVRMERDDGSSYRGGIIEVKAYTRTTGSSYITWAVTEH